MAARNKLAPVPPHIYVVSAADYEAGNLYGIWLDATEPLEDLREAIDDLLARSPNGGADGWVIADTVGFNGVRVDPRGPLERVAELARRVTRACYSD